MSEGRVVIVGAGMTAVSAAGTLRDGGYDGEIVIFGAESHPPYDRPPLSKEFLAGTTKRSGLELRDGTWYAARAIELRLGTPVAELDAASKQVRLADGSTLGFGHLLLATGGRPRTLPGVAGDRVHYLRTVEDSQRLTRTLGPEAHLTVLGGGFIGCEVAATARSVGAQVTVLEREASPMARVLGDDVGQVIATIHRDRGVDFRVRAEVTSVETSPDLVRVRMADGSVVESTELLVAVGMVPNDELAAAAGIAVDGGVLVDDSCRTSADHVYAAGDVAVHPHPLFDRLPLRVEQYDNATRQGAAAARAILGLAEAYDDPHWFWSDQYEHNLQSIGITAGYDQLVVRGALDQADFAAFYLREGRLRSVLALNRGKDVLMARKLIQSGTLLDLDRLADDSVPLNRLAPREPSRTQVNMGGVGSARR